MDFLARNPNLPSMNIDMTWIAKALWTFIVRHATRSARNTFKTLVDGEELNGMQQIAIAPTSKLAQSLQLAAYRALPICQLLAKTLIFVVICRVIVFLKTDK